jgi:hypothetical protein
LQQLRCLRPLAPNKTLSEIWHFRLKGAPEAIYRRSLWYYNLVNSPATMVNADDLENWTRGQWGLESDGGDWVSFHRNHGGDTESDGVISMWGTSHVLGNIVIEAESPTEWVVRSRFHMMELRRDAVRHFAGTYRHTLVRDHGELRIKLQRVDMVNAQAPYDYVLQVWG